MRKLRLFALCSVLTAIAMTPNPTTDAANATGRGPCSQDRYEVDHSTPPATRTKKMQALIRCVFNALDIGAQIPTALYVADRESGFVPWAINHAYYRSHDCLGLFQHMRQYWDGRVRTYLHPKYFPAWPNIGARQARANVFVTAFMVKRGGWSPWNL